MKQSKKWIKIAVIIGVIALQACFFQNSVSSTYAQGVGTITASSAKIRASADTSSEVIASVEEDDVLDVTAVTTADDGYTWYKVLDGTNEGYIRADLISVEGTVSEETTSTTTDTSTDTTESTTTTVETVTVTTSEVASAKVGSASVNVRSSASTSASIQGSAAADTVVTVTGEATGSDGKTWYQVSFVSDGSTINGFIRSDLVEVVDMVSDVVVEEETPTEETTTESEESTVVVEDNEDYYLQYTENSEGVLDWYLYDTINGTKQSLTELLSYVTVAQEIKIADDSMIQKLKIGVIVLAVVALLLITTVIFLVIKLKGVEYVYDEDEDEEEEEEEEEEIVPVTAKRNSSKETLTAPKNKKSKSNSDKKIVAIEKEQEIPKKVLSSDNTWETKNFLDYDEDDMEFEFLDLR
ncbi:MAG: SH3 domain-containing protein [Eubacteriales bacterium]